MHSTHTSHAQIGLAISCYLPHNTPLARLGLPPEFASPMPLHFRDYKPTDQVFTHVLPDGTNINIDSVRLRAWCIAMKPQIFMIPVSRDRAQAFLRDNVVSLDRVLELATRPNLDPVIFCKDGIFTEGRPDAFFVDGHHRYALCGLMGLPYIPGHILEPEQWQPFQIEGVPPVTAEHLQALPITPRNY